MTTLIQLELADENIPFTEVDLLQEPIADHLGKLFCIRVFRHDLKKAEKKSEF